jgi:hypothetical protein
MGKVIPHPLRTRNRKGERRKGDEMNLNAASRTAC